jgi:ferredoxin
MKHRVLIEGTGERFACAPQQNLLRGMEQLGLRGIPVGCRGGGCGICKVRVTEGSFRVDKMSRSCVSEAEQAEGVALACRLYPDSDLQIQVLGKMIKAMQRAQERTSCAQELDSGLSC